MHRYRKAMRIDASKRTETHEIRTHLSAIVEGVQ